MENQEQVFLKSLREAIDADPKQSLELQTTLDDLPNWDSLAVVSIVAMLDLEFGVITSAQSIYACKSVADIYRLITEKPQ